MGKFKNAWLRGIRWTFMYFDTKAGSSTFFCCSAIKVFVRVCKCALLHHGCGKSAHFIGERMRVIIYSQITRWNAVSSQQTCKVRCRVLLHIAINLKWNIDMFSCGTKVLAKSIIKTKHRPVNCGSLLKFPIFLGLSFLLNNQHSSCFPYVCMHWCE